MCAIQTTTALSDATRERNVAVVTDSAASLPEGAARALGITVVPMGIVVGGEEHLDDELAPAEIVRLANDGHPPITTSAPSPGAFLQAFDALRGRDILVVTVARRVSASFDAARIAARYRTGANIAVIDTRSAAGGQGLVVLAAQRVAATGRPLGQVAAECRRVAERVRLVAFLEDLVPLALSGRVPVVVARAGRSFGVRPLFEFAQGRALAKRPASSTANAIRRVAAMCSSNGERGGRLHAAVIAAERPEAAAALRLAVTEIGRRSTNGEIEGVDVYEAPCSAVMVAHTGPGLAGLAWWWEVPSGKG